MYHWKDIKDNQVDKKFYVNGQPVFKQFKSILKFHAPGFAPVEDESGWYHINAIGMPIYNERYVRTFGFYCERAAVTSLNGCFHINPQGIRIYSESYAWIGNYQEEICPVRKQTPDTKQNIYFHIDLNGKRLYPDNYLYAGDYRDGIAVVRNFDGLCHHIDSHGKKINDKEFLDLGVFHKNIAPARDENGWFHSNVSGKALYSKRYAALEPFYNGYALVETFEQKKQIISENGDVVLCL